MGEEGREDRSEEEKSRGGDWDEGNIGKERRGRGEEYWKRRRDRLGIEEEG